MVAKTTSLSVASGAVLKPLMFIIEIISHCARPLSLSLRLFGNMMAGHILLAVVLVTIAEAVDQRWDKLIPGGTAFIQ